MTHSLRRRILSGIIAANTVLFGINLLFEEETQDAVVNFLTCIVCWIGIYFVNWSEQIELSKNKELGDNNDDE